MLSDGDNNEKHEENKRGKTTDMCVEERLTVRDGRESNSYASVSVQRCCNDAEGQEKDKTTS